MRRDTEQLSARTFDVLIIGGGIYGACVARDAALRGLSVALIDQGDFCSGTSHNSLKIIHSGIRYFQHLDFRRVRESILERRIWLSLAPHLVRPLKFVIPTQGYLARGPLALQAAVLFHRALGLDWNRGVPEGSRIPTGRVYGKKQLEVAIPGLPMDGLSGAATWHDGQVVEADRLVIECIRSSVENGAVVANYVSAESLLTAGGRTYGVVAADRAGRQELEIRARVTVNAGGPWAEKILRRSLGSRTGSRLPRLAKNMNIVTHRLLPDYGVGIPSKRHSDAVIGSETRLFFITPWKDVSAIGTTHFPYDGDPDEYAPTEAEVSEFVDEINDSYPPAALSMEDVLYVYSGLTPAEADSSGQEVDRSRHADIIDHGRRDGCDGLISVIGVKFTTGRLVAERVVSLVQRKLGVPADSSRKSRTVLLPGAVPGDALHWAGPDGFPGAEAYAARVRHAVDHEMAIHLEDFLLRRDDLAARGKLTEPLVRLAADAMGRARGWSATETEAAIDRCCAAIRTVSSRVADTRKID